MAEHNRPCLEEMGLVALWVTAAFALLVIHCGLPQTRLPATLLQLVQSSHMHVMTLCMASFS